MKTMIDLKEIPPEGKEYEFSNTVNPLKTLFRGLLGGDYPYHLRFFILPIGDGFDMTGSLTTVNEPLCTRCGTDFKADIKEKIHEILIEEQEHPRGASYAKPNNFSELVENGPSITLVHHYKLDLEQFLIDIIGLAQPMNTLLCGGNTCLVHGDSPFVYEEELPDQEATNPFAALKSLRLN